MECCERIDDVSALEQSSPESLKRHRPLSPYTTMSEQDDALTDNHHAGFLDGHLQISPPRQPSSARSSISSFPASVIHNTLVTDTEGDDLPYNVSTPRRDPIAGTNPQSNSYISPFRHPSSVRAMQMQETDCSDSDVMMTASPFRTSLRKPRPSPHRYGSNPGSISIRSSSTKRSSRPGTPSRLRGTQRDSSRLKEEFPLVLLHCTLLPPSATGREVSIPPDILEAVLPPPYNKRWRTLQDKVDQNSEVKQRGVLISHPHDDYELLEERLLETLELQRPRVRQSHFLGDDGTHATDSGFESSGSQQGDGDHDNANDIATDHKCPDCGHCISMDTEQYRKYEVKVFAANGLMKGDAWAAVWSDMEKVDVEISVWMPEDVRREVDARLAALQAKADDPVLDNDPPLEPPTPTRRKKFSKTQARRDARTREIYGQQTTEFPSSPTRPHTIVDGLEEPTADDHPRQIKVSFEDLPPSHKAPVTDDDQSQSHPPTNNQSILRRCHNIFQDQRNIAIVILSVLVVFISLSQSRHHAAVSMPLSNEPAVSMPSPSSMLRGQSTNSAHLDFDNSHPTIGVANTQEAVAPTELPEPSQNSLTATHTSSVIEPRTEEFLSAGILEIEQLAEASASEISTSPMHPADEMTSINSIFTTLPDACKDEDFDMGFTKTNNLLSPGVGQFDEGLSEQVDRHGMDA